MREKQRGRGGERDRGRWGGQTNSGVMGKRETDRDREAERDTDRKTDRQKQTDRMRGGCVFPMCFV